MDKKKQPAKKEIVGSGAGISGSKRTEERLKESEARYQRITEGLTDYLYTVRLQDGQAVETTHGQACEEVTGYAKEEFADNPDLWMNMIVAEERDMVRERIQRILAGENIPPVEHRIVRKDGQIRWVSDTPILQFDSQNRLVAYDGVIKDVTVRRQMEEELQKLASVVQHSSELVNLSTPEGKMIFLNTAGGRMLGIDTQKVDQFNIMQFIPDHLKEKVQSELLPALLKGSTWEGDLQYLNLKTGLLTDVHAMTFAIKEPATGVTSYFANVSLDITERKRIEETLKESEDQFSTSLEDAPDGVYINDFEGNFLYGNRRCEEIIGYRREELIGKNFLELNILPENSLTRAGEILQDNINGKSTGPDELELISKDGRRVPVEISTSLVQRGGKKVVLAFVRDITERKRAEEALRSKQIMLERTEGIAHLGSWEWDIATDTVTWSDELFRIFQRDPQEGAPSFTEHPDFYHPDDFALLRQAVEAAVADGTPYALELQAIRKDGETRVCMARGAAETAPGGRVVRLFGSLQDITGRKQAEEALRASEERFRNISNLLPQTVFETDEKGNFTFVNRQGFEMFGYSEADIAAGMSVLEMIIPQDRDRAVENISQRIMGKDLPAHDYTAVRKDGSLFPAVIYASTILLNSKYAGMRGVLIDISDRKQAEQALREGEEKYRIVVENAHESIFIAVDGMIKFANGRAAVISGYSPEEITSMPFIDFIHPDDRQMVAERYIKWLNSEDVPTTDTVRFIFKPGNIIWGELNVVSITWEGRPAVLGFLTDVTDRKHLEEEQQRVAKLESVGLLAGGIAHDFNNILTSILGNISLASTEAAPGSELQNSLEQAEKASLRAKALTMQLLTFSKGGAPVLKLSSLTELLKDTAGFALSGSRVKCNFSIPSGLWPAEIDAGQVSQVIHNLVINAQQAMPAGGSIEIGAENMILSKTQSLGKGLPLEEGHYVRIVVTDHGIGIPAEHLEKIFDPFFTTKQKGNGMGLAISFSIARQHGGHISVESELGIGSTFYLYLPASTKMSAPQQAKKERIKPAGKARILVMDDEKGVREIAGRLLKHIGYKDIEFAADGAEAIKLYKAAMKAGNPFNVAILDLTIAGGMGGEETIKKLLKIDPGVKAIVSSGYIDDPVIAKYKDHGFSGMVAKPYTIEELRKAVQDVIG